MNNPGKKYLLLYLRTGGGHLAPARSIASQIKKLNGSIEPVMIDGFKKAPGIVKAVIEGGYRKVQQKAKWIYELLYAIYKFKFIAYLNAEILSWFVKGYLWEVIQKEQPEKIVIFHFFLIEPVMSLIAEKKLDIETFTVVTDPFTAHPLWFLRKEQNFIVFSTRLKNHCIAIGIKEWRLNVFNFILDEKFSVIPGNDAVTVMKKKYSVDTRREVILILGGGDGIPRGKKILKLLLENYRDKEIFMVCGKNKSLYKRAIRMREKGDHNNLKVFGYIDYVYDLINISDIVITKCGASTFMEIIISRKIPVVTSYIWEQEKGNKDYIVQNGMGVYVKDLSQLPDIINRVLRNIEFYRTNIDKAEIKNGAREVAEFIIHYRKTD